MAKRQARKVKRGKTIQSAEGKHYLPVEAGGGLSRRQRKQLQRLLKFFFAGILGAGAVSLQPAPAQAQAQAVRQLSALNGGDGFRLDGTVGNDQSGNSVSGAGDVNGDGFEDFIVGAHFADSGGSNSGSSYVVFGKASGWIPTRDISSLDGMNGFRLDGELANDQSGHSVSGAGDVNGDGFADLIVGAHFADFNGRYSGAGYVVFGKADWSANATVALSSLDGTNGFRLDGAPDSRAGSNVSGAGDVNGDGFADLILGAPGSDAGYVVFGKADWSTNPTVALTSLDGNNGFRLNGAAADNTTDISVSGAGDVNGDGFADLIVGADLAGFSYVVFGKASGWSADMGLSDLDGTNGFRINALPATDKVGFRNKFGYSVSGAGDVNGDGFADLIVGAFGADANGNDSGSSYVVFGKASGWDPAINLPSLNGANGFQIHGAAVGDQSGRSVSGAGDVNGDGFADLIVGAPYADFNGVGTGSSYVVFGKPPGCCADIILSPFFLNGASGFRLNGAPYDYAGRSVSGAGDVNGDGFADLIVGASRSVALPNSNLAGFTYVVFGAGDADGSGIYKSVTAAGDTPRTPVESIADGSSSTPDSRVWLDFDGGTASNETVTLARTKAGISNLEPAADVADVAWQISTTRTGWTNAKVTLKYTDAEISAISGDETGLTIFKAPAPDGPWTRQTTTIDAARNEASATVTGFSYFALAASTVPVTLSGWELSAWKLE